MGCCILCCLWHRRFALIYHEVLIASGGKFAQKAAEAGLVVFDAAPGFDSEADYRRREAQRKESNIGTKMGNFSFFSEEMLLTTWWSLPDTGGPISSSTRRSASSGL